MAKTLEVRVPDLGDFKDIPVVEVMVKPGDRVEPETPLVALESEKATMDVPSPAAGVVKEVRMKKGDRVSQGAVVVVLEVDEASRPEATSASTPKATSPSPSPST